MATCRFRFVSVARCTSPMPPAPSADRISYGPSRDPGSKVSGWSVIRQLLTHARLAVNEVVHDHEIPRGTVIAIRHVSRIGAERSVPGCDLHRRHQPRGED